MRLSPAELTVLAFNGSYLAAGLVASLQVGAPYWRRWSFTDPSEFGCASIQPVLMEEKHALANPRSGASRRYNRKC